MKIIVVVFLLLASRLDASHLVVASDSIPCDSTVVVSKSFCPHCEAWNDVFSPDFKGKIPIEFSMLIFDPEGTEIFSTTNIDKGWNGMSKESDQQMASYSWEMTYRYETNGPVYHCEGKVVVIQ